MGSKTTYSSYDAGAMTDDPLFDLDVTPLLRECSAPDIVPLVNYIERARTNTMGKATSHALYADPYFRLVDDIVYEVKTFGGNTLVNVVRGGGVPYAEIARDVCSQMKVKTTKKATVDEREMALLLKVLDDSLEKMSAEERSVLEEEFRRAGMQSPNLRPGVPIAVILAQAGIQLTGFLAYRMAVIVANAVAKAVLGRGLSLVANAALTRAIGILAGPIGWAVTALWAAVDIAGPAYRVTIPCVCHVGYLRQKRKFGDLAED